MSNDKIINIIAKVNEIVDYAVNNDGHTSNEAYAELENMLKLACKGETPTKMFIVTAVDTSDTADGKARVLAQCTTHDEAKNFVRHDMEDFIDDAAEMNPIADFNKMSVQTEDGAYGCEWNIEEVDSTLLITPKDKVEAAEKVLVDNGIEEDEASTVLQAVGYALLDTELYPEE